jgi:hypothetical protein
VAVKEPREPIVETVVSKLADTPLLNNMIFHVPLERSSLPNPRFNFAALNTVQAEAAMSSSLKV